MKFMVSKNILTKIGTGGGNLLRTLLIITIFPATIFSSTQGAAGTGLPMAVKMRKFVTEKMILDVAVSAIGSSRTFTVPVSSLPGDMREQLSGKADSIKIEADLEVSNVYFARNVSLETLSDPAKRNRVYVLVNIKRPTSRQFANFLDEYGQIITEIYTPFGSVELGDFSDYFSAMLLSMKSIDRDSAKSNAITEFPQLYVVMSTSFANGVLTVTPERAELKDRSNTDTFSNAIETSITEAFVSLDPIQYDLTEKIPTTYLWEHYQNCLDACTNEYEKCMYCTDAERRYCEGQTTDPVWIEWCLGVYCAEGDPVYCAEEHNVTECENECKDRSVHMTAQSLVFKTGPFQTPASPDHLLEANTFGSEFTFTTQNGSVTVVSCPAVSPKVSDAVNVFSILDEKGPRLKELLQLSLSEDILEEIFAALLNRTVNQYDVFGKADISIRVRVKDAKVMHDTHGNYLEVTLGDKITSDPAFLCSGSFSGKIRLRVTHNSSGALVLRPDIPASGDFEFDVSNQEIIELFVDLGSYTDKLTKFLVDIPLDTMLGSFNELINGFIGGQNISKDAWFHRVAGSGDAPNVIGDLVIGWYGEYPANLLKNYSILMANPDKDGKLNIDDLCPDTPELKDPKHRCIYDDLDGDGIRDIADPRLFHLSVKKQKQHKSESTENENKRTPGPGHCLNWTWQQNDTYGRTVEIAGAVTTRDIYAVANAKSYQSHYYCYCGQGGNKAKCPAETGDCGAGHAAPKVAWQSLGGVQKTTWRAIHAQKENAPRTVKTTTQTAPYNRSWQWTTDMAEYKPYGCADTEFKESRAAYNQAHDAGCYFNARLSAGFVRSADNAGYMSGQSINEPFFEGYFVTNPAYPAFQHTALSLMTDKGRWTTSPDWNDKPLELIYWQTGWEDRQIPMCNVSPSLDYDALNQRYRDLIGKGRFNPDNIDPVDSLGWLKARDIFGIDRIGDKIVVEPEQPPVGWQSLDKIGGMTYAFVKQGSAYALSVGSAALPLGAPKQVSGGRDHNFAALALFGNILYLAGNYVAVVSPPPPGDLTPEFGATFHFENVLGRLIEHDDYWEYQSLVSFPANYQIENLSLAILNDSLVAVVRATDGTLYLYRHDTDTNEWITEGSMTIPATPLFSSVKVVGEALYFAAHESNATTLYRYTTDAGVTLFATLDPAVLRNGIRFFGDAAGLLTAVAVENLESGTASAFTVATDGTVVPSLFDVDQQINLPDLFCLLEEGALLKGGTGNNGVCLPFTSPWYKSFSVGTTVYSVAGKGDRLYVGTNSTIRVYDISDPNALVLKSTFTTNRRVYDLEVAEGDIMYAATSGGIYKFNTANPDAISQLSFYSTPYNYQYRIQLYNDKLYVGDDNGINIRDKETFARLAYVNLGSVVDFAITNGELALYWYAFWDEGVQVRDADTLTLKAYEYGYCSTGELTTDHGAFYLACDGYEYRFAGRPDTYIDFWELNGDMREMAENHLNNGWVYIPDGNKVKVSTNNEVPSYCGNGIVEPGEVCDGNSVYCEDLDPNEWNSGTATCNSTCSGWNTGNCYWSGC